MVKVKVCGIKSLGELTACIEEGVDAVGFICGARYKTEDEVKTSFIRKALEMLPPFIESVLVTHLTDIDKISKLIRKSYVTAVQVQDDVVPSALKVLKLRFPYLKLIKAVHVVDERSIEVAKEYEGVVDAILLDSRTKDRIGGTGETHNWEISRRIVEVLNTPVILAGGLSPENVREAIEKVRPYGVDANTNLKGSKGFKDRRKVREFIRRAKGIEKVYSNRVSSP